MTILTRTKLRRMQQRWEYDLYVLEQAWPKLRLSFTRTSQELHGRRLKAPPE